MSVEDIRKAISHIEDNIERSEMRKAWRNTEEGQVEEYIEFWIRTERSEQSSDNY